MQNSFTIIMDISSSSPSLSIFSPSAPKILNTVSHAHHVASFDRIGIVPKLLLHRVLSLWPYATRVFKVHPCHLPPCVLCSLYYSTILKLSSIIEGGGGGLNNSRSHSSSRFDSYCRSRPVHVPLTHSHSIIFIT